MKIYTAGPISGQSYDQVMKRYRGQVTSLQDMGYEVICPMTGKEYLRTELEFKAHGYDKHPVSTNHAIKERDRWMVGSVDIVLVDFTECAGIVSIGSVMELAWADELKKHTIVVMEEGNIHEHCFVLECADIVFRTMDEAYTYLADLAKGISL
jgi:nucleoside 2-deoxyribosyltransferase